MAYLNTDIPELSGSDTAICLDNLELLGLRLNRITESMLAELSELADSIIRDAEEDLDTVNSILLSLQGAVDEAPEADADPGARLREQMAEINRDVILRYSAHTGVYMRLLLYRMVEDRLPAPPGDKDDRPSVADTARGRIAYMAGSFADKAYLRLATCVPHARAATFHSFVEACEEVRGGLCEYGILPLENSQNGTLTAFSRLLIRYGLCIVAVTDLENAAAGQTTRFALVCKAPDAPTGPTCRPPAGSLPLRLELVHMTDAPSVTEFLNAAVFCGLTLSRIDTLPRSEEVEFLRDGQGFASGNTPPALCVLECGEGTDLVTFRRFLSLEAPEDVILGFYGTI